MTQEDKEFRSGHARLIARVYREGGGERWNLDEALLAEAIDDSVRAWQKIHGGQDIDGYVRELNAPDLVLACACRAGNEAAWEHFIAEYRPVMYAAALTLSRDTSLAGELADSLHAELYGLEERGGKRRSLLAYFHGRSSLKTWLRAVIAQRNVDAWRAVQHLQPAADPEASPHRAETETIAVDPPEPDRARYVRSLGDALTLAMGRLQPRDRLRLHYYYLNELNLKEVGRLLGEHESTVSRKLERTRKQLRKQVERALKRDQHLNQEEIRLCYDYAIEDWPVDLHRLLSERV